MGGYDDERLEEVYNSTYSLKEFTDDSNFKSYEELDTRLQTVLGKSVQPRVVDESLEDESEGRGNFNSPDITGSNSPAWTEDVDTFAKAKASAPAGVAEEDDALSYFAKLAEED